MRSNVRITIKEEETALVFIVEGEMGKSEAETLERMMNESLALGKVNILLDMEHVQFVDSFAIKTLLRLHREALTAGGGVKLLRPRTIVKKFMTIGRVFELFNCYETRVEALLSFKHDSHTEARHPLSQLDIEARRQKRIIINLLHLLAQKGLIDIIQFKDELDRLSQLVFEIYRDELSR